MAKKIQRRDFSQRRYFPGTTGNPFDIFLHQYNRIEGIPASLFALFLFVLAVLAGLFIWPKVLILFMFFLSDWLLIWLLPKFRKSYGPPKPPVLILAILRSLVAWTPLEVFVALEGFGTLLVLYAFWIEPHTIRLTRQTLRSEKITPGESIRILHLGDLHIERITNRERQLNELTAMLQPDLILFSGDVLSLSCLKDPQALADAREILSAWKAPYGAYAVPGSPAVDLPEILPDIYAGLDIRLLKDEQVSLMIRGAAIDLFGLNCTHRPFIDAAKLPESLAEASQRLRILLYHSPDLAPEAETRSIDLQLSGHTHGGQIRLPFLGPIYTGTLHGRAFASGRYQLNDLTLYITRGIGMEGAGAPRVRFLCPPEIILWEISST